MFLLFPNLYPRPPGNHIQLPHWPWFATWKWKSLKNVACNTVSINNILGVKVFQWVPINGLTHFRTAANNCSSPQMSLLLFVHLFFLFWEFTFSGHGLIQSSTAWCSKPWIFAIHILSQNDLTAKLTVNKKKEMNEKWKAKPCTSGWHWCLLLCFHAECQQSKL